MIKIDASTVVPKRLGTYLLGLVPGVVFELTAAAGDPQAVHRMIETVEKIYPFQAYALFLLFAASCLIIGQTFFLLAWFADWLVDSLYIAVRRVVFRFTLGSDWLYRAVGRLQGMPPKRNVRQLWRVIMWARGERFPFKIRSVLKCQRMAATQLLERKYGVAPSRGQWQWVDEEWQAWLAVIGKAPVRFREAFLTMRTLLGCGLAEYAALYLVPALRNRSFAIMSGVLLGAGCFQSVSLAKRRWEPMWANITRLLFVMEELGDSSAIGPQESEKGKARDRLGATIGRESEESNRENG